MTRSKGINLGNEFTMMDPDPPDMEDDGFPTWLDEDAARNRRESRSDILLYLVEACTSIREGSEYASGFISDACFLLRTTEWEYEGPNFQIEGQDVRDHLAHRIEQVRSFIG